MEAASVSAPNSVWDVESFRACRRAPLPPRKSVAIPGDRVAGVEAESAGEGGALASFIRQSSLRPNAGLGTINRVVSFDFRADYSLGKGSQEKARGAAIT